MPWRRHRSPQTKIFQNLSLTEGSRKEKARFGGSFCNPGYSTVSDNFTRYKNRSAIAKPLTGNFVEFCLLELVLLVTLALVLALVE